MEVDVLQVADWTANFNIAAVRILHAEKALRQNAGA